MAKKITKADIKKVTNPAKKEMSGRSTSGCNPSYSRTGSCFSTMGMKSCVDGSRCSTKIKDFLKKIFLIKG